MKMLMREGQFTRMYRMLYASFVKLMNILCLHFTSVSVMEFNAINSSPELKLVFPTTVDELIKAAAEFQGLSMHYS